MHHKLNAFANYTANSYSINHNTFTLPNFLVFDANFLKVDMFGYSPNVLLGYQSYFFL